MMLLCFGKLVAHATRESLVFCVRVLRVPHSGAGYDKRAPIRSQAYLAVSERSAPWFVRAGVLLDSIVHVVV